MALSRGSRYGLLPTEQPNPASRGLDLMSARRIVEIMNREDAKAPRAVGREAAAIARAVEMIAGSLARGGRLVFIGAGTSGRLGVIEAAECPPTFGTRPSTVRAIMAGGRASVFRSKEGAEDDSADGMRQARSCVRRGDVLVGIAASGVTPFVRGGLAAARRVGARTVLVTSNMRVRRRDAEVVIALAVGPEVLAGSTRLKSATAAKLVLNMLTTAAMIRSAKTYDRWMVDLKPTSYKLRRRALRLLVELGRVSEARAGILLRASGDNVKTAVLMARSGLDARGARMMLTRSGGSLRRALMNL